MKFARILLTAGAVAAALNSTAGDWAQWRGPHFNGSSDEKGLPATWTKESAVWSADMPGPSAATPIVYGANVFLPAADITSKTLHATCFNRKDGKLVWDRQVGEGMIARDQSSNFSSPSAVADADRVFFFYGNGELAAFDHAGKPLWNRNLQKDYGEFAFQWTFSATPLLYGGKLYVEVLQRDVPVHGHGKDGGESYLLAVNPASGETIWRVVRPSDAAQESKEAYTTPMPFEFHGRKEILIAGGDCLTGSDPETGRELWRWGTWNPMKISHWRLVPSPTAGDGVVLACAPKGSPVYAIKLGGKGVLDDSAIAWKSEGHREVTSDVASPLFYDGDFFIQKEERPAVISRVEPATGKIKWTVELPGRKKYEASPIGADGKIYTMNFQGDVVVVDAAKGEVIATIAMGEPGDDRARSCVVPSNGQLFIRTNQKLFCVGRK